MKIRSRPLYAYLSEASMLNGTPEQIAHAKKAYRSLYKRNWKVQKDHEKK